MKTKRAFASWSGGKDGCLACYRSINAGTSVEYLLNMVTGDARTSRSHGLTAEWLQLQARAIGITLLQQGVVTDYETEFKKALAFLKQEGIDDGIFGDIDFNAHRDWIDRVCAESGINPNYPLWEEDQDALMKEFIGAGFETVVVATRADILGEEWLGRRVDTEFLQDLGKLPGVTPCGEAGEYHTLVIDGPLFHERLEIGETEKALREDRWYLDIKEMDSIPKKRVLNG